MQFVNTLGLLAAIAVSFVSAQTSTSCNPLQKTCPDDASLPAVVDSSFVGVSSLPSDWSAFAGSVTYNSEGAAFTINQQGQSPTIQSTGYFLFGYCEVTIKASTGQGIVSSIVLESDDLDEVDWEFTGTDTTTVESNYFGKGDTSTYNRAIYHPVSTPQNTFHTYAVNWTSSSLTWLIDGVAVRTLLYSDASGGTRYPQTPMRVKIGIWAGGDPSNGQGTIDWAGGETDYSQAPFTMTVSHVKIVNYAPASSYTFGDMSGSWQSIKINGGSLANMDGSSSTGTGSSTGATTIAGSTPSSPSSATTISSNLDAFEISTAASSISTSTAGATVVSSVPAIMPLAGSTTLSTSTSTSSGGGGSNNNGSNNATKTGTATNHVAAQQTTSGASFLSSLGGSSSTSTIGRIMPAILIVLGFASWL